MKVKATLSFGGKINMAKGETRDIPDGAVLKDLLRCGYVEPVEVIPPVSDFADDDKDSEEETNDETKSDDGTDGKKVSRKNK